MGYFKKITAKPRSRKDAIVRSLEKWEKIKEFCEKKSFPITFDSSDFGGETCACCAYWGDRPCRTSCPLQRVLYLDGYSYICYYECCKDWENFATAYSDCDSIRMLNAAKKIIATLKESLK